MFLFLRILFIFIPSVLSASIQLDYLSLTPVQQTSQVTIEVKESQPILNMSSKGSQMFKYNLVMKNGGERGKAVHLPADIVFMIKDLFISLKENESEIIFDPRLECSVPSLKSFSYLLDEPLNFSIDSHGNLKSKVNTFDRLLKEHPDLNQQPINSIVNNLIADLFALYDEDLVVGLKIEMQSSPGPIFSICSYITYTIVEINEREVIAELTGIVEPQIISLAKPLQVNGRRPQKVEMKVTGAIKGKASWQRKNALLYNLNCDYTYNGELNCGDKKWGIGMKVSEIIKTIPL